MPAEGGPEVGEPAGACPWKAAARSRGMASDGS